MNKLIAELRCTGHNIVMTLTDLHGDEQRVVSERNGRFWMCSIVEGDAYAYEAKEFDTVEEALRYTVDDWTCCFQSFDVVEEAVRN